MSAEATTEALSAGSPTADSSRPDKGDASQREQPQQQDVCMSGDESSGSNRGPVCGRLDGSSSAPLATSPHRERTPATNSDNGSQLLLQQVPVGSPPIGIQRPPIPSEGVDTHQNQQQPQPSVSRAHSMHLTATHSPAGNASAVGITMQQQKDGSGLMGGAGHGGVPGEDDITLDATSDGSRQPLTAFDIFACAQQEQAANPTRSTNPSSIAIAAAAASANRQPAGSSRPYPPSPPSPITSNQQVTANGQQGQTSGSDVVAIMSLAADALLAGDIGPFASHVEKVTEAPRLPNDDPSVEGLVRSLAKKDKAHRQQGQGGLAGCIVSIFKDSSRDIEHQTAATRFLKWLCQAGYPFGVEWLPLFGVLVEERVKRLTLSDQKFGVDVAVVLKRIPVTAEALGAFQQHMFCHIDALVETLVISSDQVIVWRAYELIGIIFRDALRFPSELGVLASICYSVSASSAALGKIATLLKDHATAQWPAFIVWIYLSVPLAMAECGYCERLAQAGFLSAAVSILQSDRLTKDGRHGQGVVTASVHLLNLILARNSYASCEGLSEVMCSLLSTVATSDAASAAPDGSSIGMAIGVLDSLASCCDRQLMSGKAKDNPIVERILQVDISALSGPPTAASQDSLIQEILDFFAKYRRRKEAIDRWVSSQGDPHREAAQRQNKQNRLVRCLSDKRILHTIYQLGGLYYFSSKDLAMLVLSCRSLLHALCPVRSTDRISSYANRELLAPFALISVSRQNRLVATLARYSPYMMLTLSIRWECSPTADDVSDLIGFLQRAERLTALTVAGADLTCLPDGECAQLVNAIGRLPSLASLRLEGVSLSRAFADRLSALLKARPEGYGKGSSGTSPSPPPSSSRDVTRIPSTSSTVVPADSAEETKGRTEAGRTADTGHDKKEPPFTTLRRMALSLCRMLFNPYLTLLEGLCGRSFETLSLSDMVLTKSEGETYRYDQLKGSMERLFGTIVCRDIHLSFFPVGEFPLPIVEDTVVSAATAALKTNPNRRSLKSLGLPVTANTVVSLLRLALEDLTLARLSLSSRVPLGKLISQQFLSSGDFASLVQGAVDRADAERESELRAAHEVKDRQWAADDARLPPAADAAEEDRRAAERQRREERLRAKETEIRSEPPFVLDLISVPLVDVSSRRCPLFAFDVFLPLIEFEYVGGINENYAYKQPVIVTGLPSVLETRYEQDSSSRLPKHLCCALVRSYNPLAPSTWVQTVMNRGFLLLQLYWDSMSHNRGPDSAKCFQNPFSVTELELFAYRQCVAQLEALKDCSAINNITQEDVDALRAALTEATRLVYQKDPAISQVERHMAQMAAAISQQERHRAQIACCVQDLHEKRKQLEVIEKLRVTLQTKLNNLRVQRAKATASKADKGNVDSQITCLIEQISKNTAARAEVVREIDALHKMVTGEEPLVEDQPKSLCDFVREELRERLESRKKEKAREQRRMERQADKTTDEAVSSAMAAREATARKNEKDLLRELDVQFSSEEDQPQHGGGGQQGGEGGKKAKKKKRHKNKKPQAIPAASASPPPLVAAAPSIAEDGRPSVREGEGEADSGLELVDSEPSNSPLHGPAAAAAASAVSKSLDPLLPDGGHELDDLLLLDGVTEHGGGGDERLAGQGAGETDGGAAGGDDGRVSGGGETEAMRARFAAELARKDQQIEALQRALMERDMAAQQQLHAAQQETHAARQETLAARQESERLREAQVAGEQTVNDTLAANERLQVDMQKANEVYCQQLTQQRQRLTSDIDRERSAREQKEAEVRQLQHHFERYKSAAGEREASLRQEVASLREENASAGEANRALQADIDQLRSNHIHRLTETFNGLTTADELSGFAMQLADRQTALSDEQSQLQSLERRAQQRARERGEAELRQEMRQQMQQSNQRARAEATECQVCQERERSVVLQPCGHFCICLQCAQTMQPRECPLCRQAFTNWTPAYFS
ncbi:unnamed protein product [Vitrella brassicaformis CCMP3155]|uniref:RING-type domain-containing protein n=1 Tax=Vitrella brassicaformis (strain CCMP3155) TaxID=1169540 RepID=A0A0G4EF25_VITBC|nr:unnamed protein product [Vitrella brassicaformis CCMP3155]|eukprot:CEL94011.1 unnamed protein product [Vitrella brassicaformis CCMP3155]